MKVLVFDLSFQKQNNGESLHNWVLLCKPLGFQPPLTYCTSRISNLEGLHNKTFSYTYFFQHYLGHVLFFLKLLIFFHFLVICNKCLLGIMKIIKNGASLYTLTILGNTCYSINNSSSFYIQYLTTLWMFLFACQFWQMKTSKNFIFLIY